VFICLEFDAEKLFLVFIRNQKGFSIFIHLILAKQSMVSFWQIKFKCLQGLKRGWFKDGLKNV